ncbi:esterase-like activity of phytase family protein [Roseibacterium beibuensis]|uniref:esterase-like activity of phytase family protein n=1 Tax=[Roseibacterium] beibuensis TaxID=1193142 RepID=UPI00217DDEAF|nr:esterase-like activity of phytase family protein [Roseibacterium beibuensis]MCS6626982.1 esterase-like activity of phytase family protein [Roseibacterium beibuensis]
MKLRRLAPLLGALVLAACATAPAPAPVAPPPAGAWSPVEVGVRPIDLGIPGGVRLAPGVQFARGFEFVADASSPFHSLSDLQQRNGWFYAVSDAGALFRFRVWQDGATNEPVSVSGFEGRALTLPGGGPIVDKADGDAEGLVVTPAGDLLVSFERKHRIWNYGRARTPRADPAAVPAPDFAFTPNDGMEAISDMRGGWRVAGESGGVWDCTLQGCRVVIAPPAQPIPDSDYRITGMDRDPGGDGFWVVERRFRPPVDVRGRVRRMAPDGTLGPVLIELSLPSTVDNFEGIAAVEHRGGVRLYILSDDNGSARQRTLLLVFDVRD